jgi:hypothetical protein
MRLKPLFLPAALAAGLVLAMLPGTAGAASGGFCQLNGTAAFNPGLTNTSGSFSYSFSGALSGCQSSDATAPVSGNVEAGKTVNVSYNWSYVDSTGTHSGTATATYQEPVPTGSGSCGSSTTAGTAITTWSDGTQTVESYSTTGAAAAVNLSGSVVPSATLTLASFTGPTQAPPASTYTVSTTRYSGDTASGLLTFQPPDPTLCASTGVTTAAISGGVGLGSTS